VVARKFQLWLGAVLLVVIGVCLAGLGWLRVQEAREFSQAYNVHTYGGTNYVAQLAETTIGRTDAGYLVIVQLRLQNPNPFPLRLNRNWFLLVDHDKDYYQPTIAGTQTEWITIPAQGVAEREPLTFAVPADSFGGTLAVQLGQNYWVLLKTPKSPVPELRPGQFHTFRRRNW
jgi:hypothetical protein